jgi:hypothetical protein
VLLDEGEQFLVVVHGRRGQTADTAATTAAADGGLAQSLVSK